jgi:hypothetical protein
MILNNYSKDESSMNIMPETMKNNSQIMKKSNEVIINNSE